MKLMKYFKKYLKNQFLKVDYDGYNLIWRDIRNDVLSEIDKITSFSLSEEEEYLEEFEKKFARYCNCSYGIGVSSGTTALQFSLVALDVKPGDEVITTPFTFVSTILAIKNVGAIPTYVDIDEKTYNINTNLIEEKITDKTKVILPVHIFGHPVDMDSIKKIANKYKLKIVEDACHAHGAEYNHKKVGSFGNTGCFSFNHVKPLGGWGNGGFVTTNDKKIWKKIKEMRNPESNDPIILNSFRTPAYLDTIQVAILNKKMNKFDFWIQKKRKLASLYYKYLNKKYIILPYQEKNCKSNFRDFVIILKERDKLRKYLLLHGIDTRIHYPNLVPNLSLFKRENKRERFPIAEKVCKEILSLPIHPFLTNEQILYTSKIINKFNRVMK